MTNEMMYRSCSMSVVILILVFAFESNSFSASRAILQKVKSVDPATIKAPYNRNDINGVNSEDSTGKSPGDSVSAAEQVAKALSCREILGAVESLIYPGEEKLHYQTQAVHQRKRQKVATNALKRLVKFLIGVSAEEERKELVKEENFYRLCACATSAVSDSSISTYWTDRLDISSYLDAIYTLGALAPLPQNVTMNTIYPLLTELNKLFINGMKNNDFKFLPTEITSLNWACERLSYIVPDENSERGENFVSEALSTNTRQSDLIKLDLVCSGTSDIAAARKKLLLPFDILHGLVKGTTNVQDMKKYVPFKAELLTTRDGKTVSERRETCWMADEG